MTYKDENSNLSSTHLSDLRQGEFCEDDPNFDASCAFIEMFGDHYGIRLDIETLKHALENQDKASDYLIDLHRIFLAKFRMYMGKYFERLLAKFACTYSEEVAEKLGQCEYAKMPLTMKLLLLKNLVEGMFDVDLRLMNELEAMDPELLRPLPTGVDIRGYIYHTRVDKDGAVRIYTEDPANDLKWKCECVNEVDLELLIHSLKVLDEICSNDQHQQLIKNLQVTLVKVKQIRIRKERVLERRRMFQERKRIIQERRKAQQERYKLKKREKRQSEIASQKTPFKIIQNRNFIAERPLRSSQRDRNIIFDKNISKSADISYDDLVVLCLGNKFR